MGSCEECSLLPETPGQTQTESASGFNSKTLFSNLNPGSEKGEESLVEGLRNLALEDNEWNGYGEDNNNQNLGVEWQNGDSFHHPLRPYAEDCTFFVKTGNCKFGSNCKFNHPVGRGFQYYRATGGCKFGNSCRYRHSSGDNVLTPLQENSFELPVGIKAKDKDGFIQQTGQIECKYYLTSGGCKYGESCRYSHSKVKPRYLEKYESPQPELNFLGLPIRTLEKECPYYMRTGSCAYGANCRFNHPDPSAAEGSNSCSSVFSGFGGHSSGNHNGGSNPLPLLSTSKPIGASLSLNRMSDKHDPYLDHNSSHAYGTHLNSEWNGSQEKAFHPYVAPSVPNAAVKVGDISELHQGQIQVSEYPERAGEPECPYFMKTGYCKYKAACKFHHPKTRSLKPPAVMFSRAGLPLRPDRKICWNYEKFGICKYGGNCHFHHPENLF
ncbi:hypothetical protein CCACVL1_05646 [Corchorus capsularis]|uniref:C3H1-type domain-containing protein n=1 Tax=Corchorus capsularis TaxID=210143 RepID=A0A1R3JJH7_COCAP|nr:hypothetical protein CCACVL1_05646 [Corchorus capsularis]